MQHTSVLLCADTDFKSVCRERPEMDARFLPLSFSDYQNDFAKKFDESGDMLKINV